MKKSQQYRHLMVKTSFNNMNNRKNKNLKNNLIPYVELISFNFMNQSPSSVTVVLCQVRILSLKIISKILIAAPSTLELPSLAPNLLERFKEISKMQQSFKESENQQFPLSQILRN